MSITFISSGSGKTDSGGATTSSFDSTGADLIVVGIGWYTGALTVTDSKSNTWNALTVEETAGNVKSILYWCSPTTVGSGHTVNVSGAGSYPSITAHAFSGTNGSPFDLESAGGNTGGGTTVQPGSLTASEANCLLVTSMGSSFAISSNTINSGFSAITTVALQSGVCQGTDTAYLIQTTATAVNPTFSWTTASQSNCVMASFKAAATGRSMGSLAGAGGLAGPSGLAGTGGGIAG